MRKWFHLLFFVSCFTPACNLRADNAQKGDHSNAHYGYSRSGKHRLGYKVVGVKDGDTFVVVMEGREQVVRLAHIDCPEKKQPFGNKSKQYAGDLCFGRYVTLRHRNKYDRNKRLIAEVILEDGRNLNKELVKAGLAWHFKKYSNDDSYAVLEAEARKNRVGLWGEKGARAPWEWRSRKSIK